jgi:EmrB/QacA subfamily drug resistance transporter
VSTESPVEPSSVAGSEHPPGARAPVPTTVHAFDLARSPLTILGRSFPRRGAITLAIMLQIFLGAVETTVVGTAFYKVVEDLQGIRLYGLANASYMVTAACFTPIFGRLSDIYGRIPFYITSLALFLLGSALSGAASSMPEFIVWRAVQGIGSAGTMGIGFTMVGDIYTLEERARVQGFLSGVWGVASVIGPLVGGFIAEKMSWRWVFYVNVPPGLLAGALIWAAWREPPRPRTGRPPLLAMALLLAALGCLFLALSLPGVSTSQRAALHGGAAVSGVLFLLAERRATTPVLDLTLLANKTFRAVVLGGVFSGVSMFASIVFVPLFAQGALEWKPTQAGESLVPLFVIWSIGSSLSGRLALRFGFRTLSVLGGVFSVVAYVLLAALDENARTFQLIAPQPLLGVGLGLTVAPLLILVQSSVARAQRGSATALTQFSRQLGGALGVAVIGGILASGLASEVERIGRDVGLPPASVQRLSGDIDDAIRTRDRLEPAERAVLRAALARAIHSAFVAALIGSVLLIPISLLVPQKAGGTGSDPAPLPAH